MKKNIGKTDSIIRIIAAVVICYFIDGWGPATQLVLGIVAALLVVTALVRICPLYLPFKFSTAKKSNQK